MAQRRKEVFNLLGAVYPVDPEAVKYQVFEGKADGMLSVLGQNPRQAEKLVGQNNRLTLAGCWLYLAAIAKGTEERFAAVMRVAAPAVEKFDNLSVIAAVLGICKSTVNDENDPAKGAKDIIRLLHKMYNDGLGSRADAIFEVEGVAELLIGHSAGKEVSHLQEAATPRHQKFVEALRILSESGPKPPEGWELGVLAAIAEQERANCLVPHCDGIDYDHLQREDLWDRYYTSAPERQRFCVERYKIVKRA